ncbi:MAG TPA: helix-turn-helix domain-containing protein [Natronosporangium sp.]
MSEPTTGPYLPWQPAAALRPLVPGMLGYDLPLPSPGCHRGLPSTRLVLVLAVGEPLRVGWHGDPGSDGRFWACLSGLHPWPADIHHRPRLAGIQLDLAPAAARALFGAPAGELAGALTELAEFAPPLADLPERLAYATSWPERLRLVEARLLDVLARAPETAPRPEVGWALRRLSQGAPVAGVAAEVGLSRRHLGALFRHEYGLTPKQYQRIARFQACRRELVRQARAGRPSLARVAAGCGYADQAHLTREWTALAGCTPTEWLRAEFPFFQDTDPAAP